MARDDNSNNGGPSRPRFSLRGKLYEMVDDPSTDSIISWSQSGKSFIVWNESEFVRDLLPRYLIVKEMSLFVAQLEAVKFRKVESEHMEYANEYFVRGQPELRPPPPSSFRSPELLKEMERQRNRLLAIRMARPQA